MADIWRLAKRKGYDHEVKRFQGVNPRQTLLNRILSEIRLQHGKSVFAEMSDSEPRTFFLRALLNDKHPETLFPEDQHLKASSENSNVTADLDHVGGNGGPEGGE